MRKLKDFFGEKTPKIAEAQERKLTDPASPIQQVIKEGSLGVKVDMIDGKVCGNIKCTNQKNKRQHTDILDPS